MILSPRWSIDTYLRGKCLSRYCSFVSSLASMMVLVRPLRVEIEPKGAGEFSEPFTVSWSYETTVPIEQHRWRVWYTVDYAFSKQRAGMLAHWLVGSLARWLAGSLIDASFAVT